MRTSEEHVPTGFEDSLENYLPAERWTVVKESVKYKDLSSYQNLMSTEMGVPFRDYLTNELHVDVSDYAGILGPVQYNVIRAQLISVFPHWNGTKGWKLVLMGFPSVGLLVFAIGHHFGDSRSQKEIGIISAGLRQMAVDILPPTLEGVVSDFPAATPADWDGQGLFSSPPMSIGAMDISSFGGGAGVRLQYVRNTTAKKDISTFFFRASLQESEFDVSREDEGLDIDITNGDYYLATVRHLAEMLGGGEN